MLGTKRDSLHLLPVMAVYLTRFKKRHTCLIILVAHRGCGKKKPQPTTNGGGMKDKGQIQL